MLKVGDEVIINESAYNSYLPGSTGTVIELNPHHVRVRFNYLVNPYEDDKNPVWWINRDHVSILDTRTPQEKVCIKIKQMEERRKNVSVYI